MGRDLLCVLPTEEDVRNAEVDQEKVKKLDGLLLHIMARGEKWDSVSRSFAPKLLVPEDPVCGSGHCHIVPYWSKKLGKRKSLPIRHLGGAASCIAGWKEVGSALAAGRRCIRLRKLQIQ